MPQVTSEVTNHNIELTTTVLWLLFRERRGKANFLLSSAKVHQVL